MDATCTIQDSIHVFNLVHKYVSRILGTYQNLFSGFFIAPRKMQHWHLMTANQRTKSANRVLSLLWYI